MIDKELLKKMYDVIEYGELWNASCALEELRNKADSAMIADFIWELEKQN